MPRSVKSGWFRAGVLAVLSLLAAAPPSGAQEFRGSLTGIVRDPSGAAVPGAKVSIKSVETGTVITTRTKENGEYTAPYILPGLYEVAVEAEGFRRLERKGIEIRVGDALRLDLDLTLGSTQETIDVTAETPLLETESASSGQVVDRRRISELPLADGNPFILTRLAPGVINTGSLTFTRAFDNNGSSQNLINGAPGGSEFTLDGTPNTADSRAFGQRVAYVPPADAVQEFKVVTTSFDAQQGRTAGANVNVTLRSGTNSFHGTAYHFLRNDKLSANGFFLNRAGRPRDPLRYNRFGGSVGGPVRIPGGYDGRNKSFFFYAYEGLIHVFPKISQFTVPTAQQKRGDFSALLNQGILIYDPATARREGARIVRSPFPGNIIQGARISPISSNYVRYYPEPNQPGDAQGRNNLTAPDPDRDDYGSHSFRFDQQLSEKNRFFVRYTHNRRENQNIGLAGGPTIDGVNPVGTYQHRINDGAGFDHVYTPNASMVFNLRMGFNRFNEPRGNQHDGLVDPTALGWPSSTVALFSGAKYLPQFNIGGFATLGEQAPRSLSHTLYALQPTLNWYAGKHSIRFGYDGRSYRENQPNPGHLIGRYDFGNDFTRENDLAATGQPIGQQLASMLLGLPTGGLIDRNAWRANEVWFHGFWIQDDWKVTSRLTLNVGLRYEYESATVERYNRNTRGFDSVTPSPIEPAARAAYAQAPIPQIAPAQFNVRGGLLFASPSARGFWDADRNGIQPRIGAAFRLTSKTVLRGGWGAFMAPFGISGLNMPGFSQSTLIVPTLDNGLSFVANLANPFPNGIENPPGASQGIGTFLGRGISFVPINRRNAMSYRYEFGLQHELPGQWLVEMSYVGTANADLAVSIDMNPVPRQYMTTSPVRDQAAIDFLSANITNPFRGLIPGTGLNGNVVQRQQLLRPYPHFTGITGEANDGVNRYNSLQATIERRFSRGFTFLGSWTWSKLLEKVSLLNPTDDVYERRLSANDAPHRVVFSGIYELPFGKGRRYGSNWKPLVNGFLGGYQVQGIYQYQTGFPMGLGNVYYSGPPLRSSIRSETVDAVFPIEGFYFSDAPVQTNGIPDPAKQRNDMRIRLESNLRTLPSRIAGFRGDSINTWDLSVIKAIPITEGVNLQFRAEFLNAFNTPIFGGIDLNPRNASFGRATNQANLPRNVQLALRLVF